MIRPLEELKSLTLYDMNADEIKFLELRDPQSYKAAADAIDGDTGPLQDGELRVFENGRKI